LNSQAALGLIAAAARESVVWMELRAATAGLANLVACHFADRRAFHATEHRFLVPDPIWMGSIAARVPRFAAMIEAACRHTRC
jgi:hypothetical protein